VIYQYLTGFVQIISPHHQTARQYADRSFKDAHVYVHFKAVYTLSSEHG